MKKDITHQAAWAEKFRMKSRSPRQMPQRDERRSARSAVTRLFERMSSPD
jgi:hypothetical protein